jgi:hypothetical protein
MVVSNFLSVADIRLGLVSHYTSTCLGDVMAVLDPLGSYVSHNVFKNQLASPKYQKCIKNGL